SDSAFRDAAELFGVEGVPRFELVMEETTYEAHQRRALEEEYTPVTACYDGERIGRIAMRFKGQVGTLQNCFQDGRLVCDKLSMRLKFGEDDESLRFFGLKRLTLHSMKGTRRRGGSGAPTTRIGRGGSRLRGARGRRSSSMARPGGFSRWSSRTTGDSPSRAGRTTATAISTRRRGPPRPTRSFIESTSRTTRRR